MPGGQAHKLPDGQGDAEEFRNFKLVTRFGLPDLPGQKKPEGHLAGRIEPPVPALHVKPGGQGEQPAADVVLYASVKVPSGQGVAEAIVLPVSQ